MMILITMITAQKFSIKDFSSKCDQIRSFQRIWSHLLEKSLMDNTIFCVLDDYSIEPMICMQDHFK